MMEELNDAEEYGPKPPEEMVFFIFPYLFYELLFKLEKCHEWL
jgi:hypothetical protein